MKKKVILLTEIISPYRIPVFNEIAKELGGGFLALFFSETVREREWKVNKAAIKFNYKVLPSVSFRRKKDYFPCFFSPTLFYTLIQNSPEVIIIGGYHHPSSLLAIIYAKLFRKRVILWCESNKYEQRSYHPLKEAYKRWYVKNCNAYIAPGKASCEYLVSLGAENRIIYIAPNAVDNDYFNQACSKYRQNKEALKKSRNYPDKIILYVGRLIDKKGIFDLLKAFQIISDKQSDIGLLLVGSGEKEKHYKDFCKNNQIKNIFFTGFLQQEELPLYYGLSDVFVLPTHSDPWGLVLNEAMACGLPVISSDAAGGAQDLIIHRENGYIFKMGDINKLVGCLKDILGDEQKRTKMGDYSLGIIKGYSPLRCAQGFIQAIKEI